MYSAEVKTINPDNINYQFKQYTTLYSSEPPNDLSHISDFLDDLTIPEINPKAIKSMHSSKAPGPDDFSIEIYKEFASLLAPIPKLLYQEIFKQQKLTQTMMQAILAILLRKDTNPVLCGSYHPVSLVNCDYKIFTKHLATHIETVAPMVANPDQTGFMLGSLSTTCANYLMYCAHHTPQNSQK